MPALCLQDLPTELMDSILTYLPIPCLLAFSQTNQWNQTLAIHALDRLELAIFPKRIHSMLAFIEAGCRHEHVEEDDELSSNANSTSESVRRSRNTKHRTRTNALYQIGLTTPQTVSALPTRPSSRLRTTSSHKPHHRSRQFSPPAPKPLALTLRTQEMNTQNQLATKVLSSRSLSNIQSLTLHLYDLTSPDLSETIATSFPHMQHLTLNFTHAYINDCTLPARYWRDTPDTGDGSTAWNAFSNISHNPHPTSKPKLSTLKSLTLRRAGITTTQLQKWIEHNPDLVTLSLEKVRGVTVEFCNWLADHLTSPSPSSSSLPNLRRISLEDNAHLKMNTTQEFAWLERLRSSNNNSKTNLDLLSLESCPAVNEAMFNRLASPSPSPSPPPPSQIKKLISPRGTTYRDGRRDASAHQEKLRREGSRSPALTVTEAGFGVGVVGTWKAGVMEVDPDL